MRPSRWETGRSAPAFAIAPFRHFAEDFPNMVVVDPALRLEPIPRAFLQEPQFFEPATQASREMLYCWASRMTADGSSAPVILQLMKAFREALGRRQEGAAKGICIAFIAREEFLLILEHFRGLPGVHRNGRLHEPRIGCDVAMDGWR